MIQIDEDERLEEYVKICENIVRSSESERNSDGYLANISCCCDRESQVFDYRDVNELIDYSRRFCNEIQNDRFVQINPLPGDEHLDSDLYFGDYECNKIDLYIKSKVDDIFRWNPVENPKLLIEIRSPKKYHEIEEKVISLKKVEEVSKKKNDQSYPRGPHLHTSRLIRDRHKNCITPPKIPSRTIKLSRAKTWHENFDANQKIESSFRPSPNTIVTSNKPKTDVCVTYPTRPSTKNIDQATETGEKLKFHVLPVVSIRGDTNAGLKIQNLNKISIAPSENVPRKTINNADGVETNVKYCEYVYGKVNDVEEHNKKDEIENNEEVNKYLAPFTEGEKQGVVVEETEYNSSFEYDEGADAEEESSEILLSKHSDHENCTLNFNFDEIFASTEKFESQLCQTIETVQKNEKVATRRNILVESVKHDGGDEPKILRNVEVQTADQMTGVREGIMDDKIKNLIDRLNSKYKFNRNESLEQNKFQDTQKLYVQMMRNETQNVRIFESKSCQANVDDILPQPQQQIIKENHHHYYNCPMPATLHDSIGSARSTRRQHFKLQKFLLEKTPKYSKVINKIYEDAAKSPFTAEKNPVLHLPTRKSKKDSSSCSSLSISNDSSVSPLKQQTTTTTTSFTTSTEMKCEKFKPPTDSTCNSRSILTTSTPTTLSTNEFSRCQKYGCENLSDGEVLSLGEIRPFSCESD